MATNFLIALAAALGSSAVFVVILRAALKLISPESFKEALSPNPRGSVIGSKVVIDQATLVALSGEELASLFNLKQGISLHLVSSSLDQNIGNESRKKTTMEEVLSPPGQSTALAAKESKRSSGQGATHAAVCGLAG
jgi:hypothetical protein